MSEDLLIILNEWSIKPEEPGTVIIVTWYVRCSLKSHFYISG